MPRAVALRVVGRLSEGLRENSLWCRPEPGMEPAKESVAGGFEQPREGMPWSIVAKRGC